MAKSLRIGIVGAGFMGQTHTKNLGRLPAVKVVAVCEKTGKVNPDVFGKMPVFTDFDEMLAGTKLDAVAICIPPFAHGGEVEKAAAAGLHILLEKPIALTVARANRMARAVAKAGVVSQVGYHFRHAEPVRRLRAMIASGQAGRPTLFQGRYFCNCLHSEWWRDVRKSGGQVLEQAIHVYDLAMHLLGSEPDRVAGMLDNLVHKDADGYTVEDTSAAVVHFRNGAMASISATNCAVPWEWTASFNVVCEKLTAYFKTPTEAEFVCTAQDPVKRETVAGGDDPYFAEARDFIDAIRKRRPALAPIAEGLTGLKLVAAVCQSSEKGGQIVRIARSSS